jgi:hypothetical protein
MFEDTWKHDPDSQFAALDIHPIIVIVIILIIIIKYKLDLTSA